MENLAKLKRSKVVMLFGFIAESAISYGFVSLAISRGNLWWYILAFVFAFLAVKNLSRLIGSFISNGPKKA